MWVYVRTYTIVDNTQSEYQHLNHQIAIGMTKITLNALQIKYDRRE